MTGIEIVRVRYDDPLAQRLVLAALGDLSTRYGGPGDATPVDAAEFQPPDGAFLIALLDGEPAACAGWRSHDANGEVAELKRMYTAPVARGRGLARRMLVAVEESARSYGRKRMILETGDLQPEAVGLYQSSGYARIPDFGYYRDEEGVMSFGRDL